mgnify:CR=1 FL=1
MTTDARIVVAGVSVENAVFKSYVQNVSLSIVSLLKSMKTTA